MPNRLLKEGIVDSERINSLSAEAEVCFYRLLVVSDDLGRMDARTQILRARCFPLKESHNLSTKIETWLEEMVKLKLIERYIVDARPYLIIANWDQRVRSKGKYPAPVDGQQHDICQSIDGQVPADGGLGLGLGLGLGSGLGLGNGLGVREQKDVLFDASTGGWNVPDVLRIQWGNAYPAVCLDTELSSAAAWLIANPKNKKSNYARFLTNWLRRSQDRAPRLRGAIAGASERLGNYT